MAAKENKADLIAGIDLSDQSEVVAKILIDLRQRLTKNDSAVFAKSLIRELGKTTQLLRNNHRFAGFAVLKAPDIPSVLVEMGYLSNRTDERLLKSRGHRKKIAAAVVKAAAAPKVAAAPKAAAAPKVAAARAAAETTTTPFRSSVYSVGHFEHRCPVSPVSNIHLFPYQ